MELIEALRITIDLALENLMTPEQAADNDMIDEPARQQEALLLIQETVEEFTGESL